MVENKKRCKVFLVGPTPPPVHGASLMLQTIRSSLAAAEKPVVMIDIAAESLDRARKVRIRRLSKVVTGVFRILSSQPRAGDALYMSVSGGFGKVYELVFAALARSLGFRVFLRHCSYAYLDQQSVLARLLVAVAGTRATHVVLSDEMRTKLLSAYPACRRIRVVGNAVFVESTVPIPPRIRQSLKTIGFISNISEEKGVFDFLAVARQMEVEGWRIAAKLAGPFDDSEVEARVRNYLKSLKSVEYVGPRYAEQKSAFFDSIDVLLFPTRYVNEASPVTVHEAIAHGIPVIAYGRGAISELIAGECGLVVERGADFVEPTIRQLKVWSSSPEAFRRASGAARDQFNKICSISQRQWAELQMDLC